MNLTQHHIVIKKSHIFKETNELVHRSINIVYCVLSVAKQIFFQTRELVLNTPFNKNMESEKKYHRLVNTFGQTFSGFV